MRPRLGSQTLSIMSVVAVFVVFTKKRFWHEKTSETDLCSQTKKIPADYLVYRASQRGEGQMGCKVCCTGAVWICSSLKMEQM